MSFVKVINELPTVVDRVILLNCISPYFTTTYAFNQVAGRGSMDADVKRVKEYACKIYRISAKIAFASNLWPRIVRSRRI
jgi:hypothetical protein